MMQMHEGQGVDVSITSDWQVLVQFGGRRGDQLDLTMSAEGARDLGHALIAAAKQIADEKAACNTAGGDA